MTRFSATKAATPFLTLFALLVPLFTGSPAEAQDTSRAQELRSQALAAADRKNWQQALDLLQQAQLLVPEDPATLYSLGVVYAKAGHDVPAMFWLKAYLLAAPDAQNTVQVVQQISANERMAREKEKQLYAAAIMRAKDVHDGLDSVAFKLAEAGHLEDALKLISAPGYGDPVYAQGVQLNYASFAAWTGDIAAAREALSRAGQSAQLPFPTDFPVCQSIDYHTVQAILEAGLRGQASPHGIQLYTNDYAANGRKSRAGMTPLKAWIDCARDTRYYDIDVEAALKPEALSNASYDDPEREPGVIARYGAEMGLGVARFRTLESLLVQ